MTCAILLSTQQGLVTAFASGTPSAFECPATLPNNVDAPDHQKLYAADGHTWYEDGIWVSIPIDGTLQIGPQQQLPGNDEDFSGWGFEKLMVLRSEGARGYVEISGERLDVPSDASPTSQPDVEYNYGTYHFVPVMLMVPCEGCWKFTATAGDYSATWVMDVKFVDEAIATPTS